MKDSEFILKRAADCYEASKNASSHSPPAPKSIYLTLGRIIDSQFLIMKKLERIEEILTEGIEEDT